MQEREIASGKSTASFYPANFGSPKYAQQPTRNIRLSGQQSQPQQVSSTLQLKNFSLQNQLQNGSNGFHGQRSGGNTRGQKQMAKKFGSQQKNTRKVNLTEDVGQIHVTSYRMLGSNSSSQGTLASSYHKSHGSAGYMKDSAQLRQKLACVRIQAFFRGAIVRQRLQRLIKLRWAIRAIQAWVRGVFTRRSLARKGHLVRIGSKRARVFNREMFSNQSQLCCASC